MLKTSSTESAKPRKGRVEVVGDGRDEHDGRAELDGRSEVGNGEVDGNEVGDDEVAEEKDHQKTPKTSKSKKTIRSLDFFTPRARLTFTELRQVFVKAPILHHFDLERHIRIKTDASGYGVLSQLTSDNSGRWHPVAFFSRKMIPAETRYKIHDGELLAIVEAFKT